jgi:hypothetical protein
MRPRNLDGNTHPAKTVGDTKGLYDNLQVGKGGTTPRERNDATA